MLIKKEARDEGRFFRLSFLSSEEFCHSRSLLSGNLVVGWT